MVQKRINRILKKKIVEAINIKETCDFFDFLLFYCVTLNISIENIPGYPILREPLCFSHLDESMYQIDKKTVFDYLTENVQSLLVQM